MSVPTAEDDDDEELVFAASQCEAQINTGVAYDTNAHIKRMFFEKRYVLKIKSTLLIFFVYDQNYVTSSLKRDAFFECTSSHLKGCTKVSVYLFAFPELTRFKQSPNYFSHRLLYSTRSLAPPQQDRTVEILCSNE